MKKMKARELIWMCVPVVLLGGVAWWFGSGGSRAVLAGAPVGIEQGKPRLEIEKIDPWELSSADVAEGFVWGKQVTLWRGGKSPFAVGFPKPIGGGSNVKAAIFFRENGVWKKAQSPDGWAMIRQTYGGGSAQYQTDFVMSYQSRFKVRLNGIPSDATEIRLRGVIDAFAHFQTSACGGVNREKGWTFYGPNSCSFSVSSKQFDWVIKAENQPFPAPSVSHVVPLRLVEARFVSGKRGTELQLGIKRISPSKEDSLFHVGRPHLTDGDGRSVDVYDSKGVRQGNAAARGWTQYARDLPELHLAPDEYLLFSPFFGNEAPQGGWAKVKRPLFLEAFISDHNSWPLHIKVPLREIQTQYQPFVAKG